MNIDKQYNLTENKSFCMLPWTHLHITPTGLTAPCCIATTASNPEIDNIRNKSIQDAVNSDKMNNLRKKMLLGELSKECNTCHIHEQKNVHSTRQVLNKELVEFYDESVPYTNSDGSLNDFKMRYFDIRFSNICNFKCRTCGPEYSSQWGIEINKNQNSNQPIIIHIDNGKGEVLGEVLEQVPNIKLAYFAGGEPLITEEHYVILEEMVRTGAAKDIQLKYNTNASNLKYKDKDLLSIWKHFDKGVIVDASVDHYGARAEYIRHGTNWATIEENIKLLQTLPYVTLRLNTVLSVFNLLTIGDFYEYLIKNNLYTNNNTGYLIYNMISPEYLACHILPPEYKNLGKNSIISAISLLLRNKFRMSKIVPLKNAYTWTTSYNTWDIHKEEFKREINRIDSLRNEDFRKTFPELAGLLDTE